MATDARPAKRTRTEPSSVPKTPRANEQPPLSDLKLCEEFWLEDGNIVLVTRDVAFRIYRGLLAAQSKVFEDMFASAAPTTDETLEGCPVVRLSDSPEDLMRLLRVLLPKTKRT